MIFMMGVDRSIAAAIFAASLSSLAYEIALIRIFSITLWYHFAFMVISIAMLGIGASGTVLSLFPGLRTKDRLPGYFFLFSLALPLSYLLMKSVPFEPARLAWDRIQVLSISLYYLCLAPPFFVFGLIISTSFSVSNFRPAAVYGADLTGAGTGSVLVLLLLSAVEPWRAVFIISAVSTTTVFFAGKRRLRLAAAVLLFLNVAAATSDLPFLQSRISPYKPVAAALEFPGARLLKTSHGPFSRVDIFESPAARFAPGLSLRYLDELPHQTGISVDGGAISAITTASDKNLLRFINFLPSSLPYVLAPVQDVLLIDPKGGLPVLMARHHGAGRINSAESDALVMKTVREFTADESIYSDQDRSGLGRSILIRSGLIYDLIDISVSGAMPSGSFGFSEDYRFTVEAFETYLNHLGPEGMLSLTLFIIPPPRTELRLLATAVEALTRLGIHDASRHIAAIRTWGTVTFLMKRSPLTDEDIGRIRQFAGERRFDLLHLPDIAPEETNVYVKMPTDEYFSAAQSLIIPERRADFLKDYLFDIRPATDAAPFFHYYLKLRNIREIYHVMGEKWQYFLEEGYLLPIILIQVSLLGLALILLPFARRRRMPSSSVSLASSLSYFALLGIAFLFVEIAYVHRMILPLENPAYAASAILASILIGSGAGSLLSEHIGRLRKAGVLLALPAVIFMYSLGLAPLIGMLTAIPLAPRIAVVFLLFLPAGFFMGLPFPLGISLLRDTAPHLVPWAWAVNGCFSVLAPILAIMLALTGGFTTVLLTGVLAYALAFGALRRMGRPP